MKKTILLILLAALVGNTIAQSSFANDQENLKKYWYYRQRLKENFIFMSDGNERGSNLPVDRIMPNVEGIDSEGNMVFGTVRYVDWDDCNGALPYYIMLLATEYKLLKKYANANNNNNLVAAETLHELQNAVNTIERLDEFADNSINGVFRRSDLIYLDDRNYDPLDDYKPLVNHFTALAHNKEIEYHFAEAENKTPVSNLTKERYNSQDNVLKFIEAEALAREMLKTYSDADAVRNKLYDLTSLMIQNMYHPDEPRSFWNRDKLAKKNGILKKTWYLKDPDNLGGDLDGLIPKENGGAGDLWTYFTSYGYAKSAKTFGLDYKGTDLSWYLFKRAMIVPYEPYSMLSSIEVTYDNCNTSSYYLYLADVSGNRDPVIFKIFENPFFWCNPSETLEVEKIKDVHSEWFFRTLAAVNDISPSWMLHSIFPKYKSTYKYLLKKAEVEQAPLDQLPLIWSIMNNVSQISDYDRAYIGNLLNEAPACGPWNIGSEDDNRYHFPEGSFEWSSPNRFVWPELRGNNPLYPAWKRTGYYNGIDYMVLHNLYWLTKVESNLKSATVVDDTGQSLEDMPTYYEDAYVDYRLEDRPSDISSKSEHVYARERVTLSTGFDVVANSDFKYVAGTASDMRRTSDNDYAFTKVDVSTYAGSKDCQPIFKVDPSIAKQISGGDQLQKSADLDGNGQSELVTPTIINIYPNPTTDNLTVTSNQSIQDILLLNSTGKILFEFSDLNANKHTFNLSNIKPGLYLVKTTMYNGFDKVEKILKKE